MLLVILSRGEVYHLALCVCLAVSLSAEGLVVRDSAMEEGSGSVTSKQRSSPVSVSFFISPANSPETSESSADECCSSDELSGTILCSPCDSDNGSPTQFNFGLYPSVESSDDEMQHPGHPTTANETPPTSTAAQVTSIAPEDEIQGLNNEFRGLVDQTAADIDNSIENGKIKLSQVKRSITLLPVSPKHLHVKFLQGKLSTINTAKVIDKIFLVLGSYWDFMNCGLLELLVEKFGSMETQQRMVRYLKRLKEFRMQTTMREFTDKWMGDSPSNFAEFILEVTEEWMDRSLEAVEELRTRFSHQCSFNEYALPLKKGTSSVQGLCFALQRSFPMSAGVLQPARQFLQEQGVLRVFFKGVCLFDGQLFKDQPVEGSTTHQLKTIRERIQLRLKTLFKTLEKQLLNNKTEKSKILNSREVIPIPSQSQRNQESHLQSQQIDGEDKREDAKIQAEETGEERL